MSGKSSVWMALIVAIAVVVLSVGGALAAQDSRPAAPAHLAQQAATPQPNADPQRVIDALAAYFGVPADEIQALFDSGAGLGVIAEAYALADVTGMTPQEIVAAKIAGELNWGQFLKDAGVDPAQVKVKLGDIVSAASQAQDVQQTAAVSATDGQGDQLQDRDRTQAQDRDQDCSGQQAQMQQQSQSQTQNQTQSQQQTSGGSSDQGSGGSQGSDNSGGNGGSDGGNGNGGGGKNK